MRNTTRKCLALFLAVLQLAVLFPLTAFAENADQSNSETPVLNEMKVGTVQFQSFNFLGDNATGSDGVDYTSTFYYTDDFFSPSAIHETNSTSLKWSDLTASEMSLASMSFDFATAAYATNVGNVKNATSRTWDNTDYSDKAVNARNLLTTCGFEGFEAYDYNHAPTNDSIAYVIAHKKITVWDETANDNKEFTLVAVGVRGAGYGAEWASNVTIGNKSNNQLPANGRHWGFDDAAVTICAGIRSYLTAHNITSDAKYWITGFSRAGATANLVAGYVTDGAESTYHTHQRDVYGFTWECPKGAAKSESALNYKNIHNIINAMDAVPKVSPDAFQHQRLGVDYVMPYYGNTSTSENTAYYTRMREVLKTIAVGAYNYGGESYQADPLIEYTDPANYPYNRTMTVYTITATRLIGDAIDGVLMDNFGTVEATGSNKKLTAKYIDKFIDDLINVFLVSGAWSGKIGASNTTSALNNRTKFIAEYQAHFRNVLGYLLDYSGPAFLGMVDALIDAVGDQMSMSNTVTNAGLGLAFLNFYEYPTSTYKWGVPPFIDPWVGSPSWAGQTRRAVLVSEAQPVVKNVIRNMVGDFIDPQGITRTTFENSMDKLVELVVNLYADELSRYNSNYFGTTLHYMWQILCVHEQEVVMSWIKSLDSNHMNRSARTITIPAGCDATLYEFRPEFEGNLNDELDTSAPVVAEVKNGALVTETLKDQRIYSTTSNGNIDIRYPASLQIRADIKSASGFNTGTVKVADYRTTNAYINVSNGKSQYETTTLNSSTGYSSVTSTTATNVTAANTALSNYGVALAAGDTLHILADEIGEFNENKPQTYSLSIDKVPEVTVLDYGTPSDAAGTDQSSAILLGVNKTSESTVDNSHGIKTRQTQLTIPASSVYYDDDFNRTDLTGDPGDTIFSSAAEILDVENTTQYWYKFQGSRVDVYCTTYNQEGTGENAVTPGYVQAKVLAADKQTVVQTATIRNQSDVVRYNVPTLSFDGLTPGETYYLVLNVLKSSNYKLDGIRVYNAIADQSAYEGSSEQYGAYINLRDALVNNGSSFESFNGAVSGALFIDDPDKLELEQQQIDGTTGEPVFDDEGEPVKVKVYKDSFEAYQKNSPKNEIYLDEGETITFTLTSTAQQPGTKLWVGLSAPDDGKNTGRVKINGTEVPVNSAVDTYYEITAEMLEGRNGSVTITNTTDSLISVTNLKITGNQDIYNAVTAPKAKASSLSVEDAMATTLSVEDAMPLVFAPLTMRTVMLAANDGVDPEVITAEPETSDEPETPDDPEVIDEPEETPEPTPTPVPTPAPTPTPTPHSIASFINAVFRSISRLFRF